MRSKPCGSKALIAAGAVVLSGCATANPGGSAYAEGEGSSAGAVEQRIADLEARVQELSEELRSARLVASAAPPAEGARRMDNAELAGVRGAGLSPAGAPDTAASVAQVSTPPESGREKELDDRGDAAAPPEEGAARVQQRELESVERALIQANSLVLPPWELELEPSLRYTHSSGDVVIVEGFSVLPAIVIGEIVSNRIRRDTLEPAISARLGLPWNLQADVRIPYRHETLQTVSADQAETEVSRSGLGDVTLGLSGQVFRETGFWPDVLLRGEVKTTTGGDPFDDEEDIALGSGFYGVRGSATFVKSADPAVLFATLGYVANLPSTKSFGKIDPGDTLELSVGAALALSRELSLTFGWQSSFTGNAEVDNREVPGSNATVNSLLFGLTYAPAETWALDLSFSVGAGDDAPDAEVVLAVPFRL